MHGVMKAIQIFCTMHNVEYVVTKLCTYHKIIRRKRAVQKYFGFSSKSLCMNLQKRKVEPQILKNHDHVTAVEISSVCIFKQI